MTRSLIALAATFALAFGSFASIEAKAPCRDTKGKFVKCPPPAPLKPVRCRDAKGKFAKCGTPGAKPS
jgi:hypothetical protein